ncbi:MAG: hypothetical protein QM767_17425 [Anaeromyxobacter sp.]
MRSVNRLAALAALAALVGCGGSWSNSAIPPAGAADLGGVPGSSELQVWVPAPPAAPACDTRPAATWLAAAGAASGMNQATSAALAQYQRLRSEASTLADGLRVVGPVEDGAHADRERLLTLVRAGGAVPRFTLTAQARVKGTLQWTTVLTGVFDGASASGGTGTLTLDLDALQALGMAEEGWGQGAVVITYDRRTEAASVGVDVAQDTFGVLATAGGYGWTAAGTAGPGLLVHAQRDQDGGWRTVTSRFDGVGVGRDEVVYTPSGGASASYAQCWDQAGCLTWVDDPADVSCEGAPCSLGSQGGCLALP